MTDDDFVAKIQDLVTLHCLHLMNILIWYKVLGRIGILRGNVKDAADLAVTGHYGLLELNSEQVKDRVAMLLDEDKYIFLQLAPVRYQSDVSLPPHH